MNILIHLKKENKYLLFYQNKYGLEKPALATLGGLFNAGETAVQCAARELEEETGLVAGEMVPLGKVLMLLALCTYISLYYSLHPLYFFFNCIIVSTASK